MDLGYVHDSLAARFPPVPTGLGLLHLCPVCLRALKQDEGDFRGLLRQDDEMPEGDSDRMREMLEEDSDRIREMPDRDSDDMRDTSERD